jgi:hypothetical protein
MPTLSRPIVIRSRDKGGVGRRREKQIPRAPSLALRLGRNDKDCGLGGSVNFLSQLLRGISFIPALVSGIEGLLGGRTGAQKKDAAMSFLENALNMTDAIARREIVNPEQFSQGVSQIVDGVVTCMNSSAWAKSGTQTPTVSPQT